MVRAVCVGDYVVSGSVRTVDELEKVECVGEREGDVIDLYYNVVSFIFCNLQTCCRMNKSSGQERRRGEDSNSLLFTITESVVSVCLGRDVHSHGDNPLEWRTGCSAS